MREIRTLRAMWRALETEPRQIVNGHEEGNLGNKPRTSLRAAAPALDPTNSWKDLIFAEHRCFSYIRDWVEKKIRRHLARACQRRGFGWKRWSRE